ncbi:MAG TPA: glycoside hydrolase family 3 C-terminal domain-containing protein, partial [Prolixibacteraceae bacterium]|nr:glycoside hydrolase family 3 C-terminal domain-containing protein [Prolixibacteraceae bacterium]
MKHLLTLMALSLFFSCVQNDETLRLVEHAPFVPFTPPVSYEAAQMRADSIVKGMTIDERIAMIGGHNFFFVHEVKSAGLPRLYLSDATQGVHLRKNLDSQLEKSVAMPCPILLTSTWDRELAKEYARCIGEECRAGEIAVLLGPGMNLYRISENGRNFEYFGEDPYLAARMVENYVVGLQGTGTLATLKHFVCNNSDHRRRTSNSVVSERTLHELYLPAFKAGVDAGAMAVMTSYNQVNGEWAGQSDYVINQLLRKDLGFKWLVMSDWWAVWDPVKAFRSGLDLDMPGEGDLNWAMFRKFGDTFLRSNAPRLLREGIITEEPINRMARNIIATELAMQLDKRPVKDSSFLQNFPEHEEVALKTAREGIVLLKNKNALLPLKTRDRKILATGFFLDQRMSGGGSADVEGYNWITLQDALRERFGEQVIIRPEAGDEEIASADVVLVSIGTRDSEGWNRSFNLPEEMDRRVKHIASLHQNVIVLVNSGGGINMSLWNDDVEAILYAWFPGQAGNRALVEILAGDISPSGKLPITLEKKLEDSPGYPYLPEGEDLYTGWEIDSQLDSAVYDIVYNEGVLSGYRWYETKAIEPLYPFGFGLSYATFSYSRLKLSSDKMTRGDTLKASFVLENTGDVAAAEIAQLYIHDAEASVERPVKELKNFIRVPLQPGEKVRVELDITPQDLSFYDEQSAAWVAEPGLFVVMVGAA